MINQVGANFAQEMVSYYAARVAFERIVVDSDKPRYVQNDLDPHITILEKLQKERERYMAIVVYTLQISILNLKFKEYVQYFREFK